MSEGLEAGSAQVDVNNLDPSQLQTFREFLSNYNKVSERCFRSCMWDFTSRNILAKEDRCANACVEKYLKANQRVSQRFQEIQALNSEAILASMQHQQQ